jgi:hypothetical protein
MHVAVASSAIVEVDNAQHHATALALGLANGTVGL